MRVKQWLDRTYDIPDAIVETTWDYVDDKISLKETVDLIGRLVDVLYDRDVLKDDEVLYVLGAGWKAAP